MSESGKSEGKSGELSLPEVEKGQVVTISDPKLPVAVDQKAAQKDKALALLASDHVVFDANSPEAKRVLRKIDKRIMPMIFLLYMLMLMDKNSLSLAAIMGIKKDCHLSGNQFSWLGSLIFFGYLVGEPTSVFLFQRLPLAKVLSSVCILWGITVALHAVCRDFTSLAILRFFLGIFESFTVPGVLAIFGSWYTKDEQVPRLAIWYTCFGFSNVFGGFFAWAIYQGTHFRWQGLFILYGTLTFFLGIFLFWYLAASPTGAIWLTEEEKTIALERVRENKTGTEVWPFNPSQLKEAFLDIRFYLIALFVIALGIPTGGLAVFGPSIIAGFGFNTDQSTLLTLGTGAASVCGILLAITVAKYTNRTFTSIFMFLLSAAGVAMMVGIPSKNYRARFGGYVLGSQFSAVIPFSMTYLTGGVGGTTKKFAFSSAFQLGYAIGNIIGPQTYRAKDAPTYYTAKFIMLAMLIFCAILLTCIGLIHWSWNAKRDNQNHLDAQNGVVHAKVENEEFTDLTDWHIRTFKYPL